HRQAHDAAAVADHEVDRLGRGPLRGEHEVALVLAVGVVDEDHHPPGAEVLEDLGNRRERHAGTLLPSPGPREPRGHRPPGGRSFVSSRGALLPITSEGGAPPPPPWSLPMRVVPLAVLAAALVVATALPRAASAEEIVLVSGTRY